MSGENPEAVSSETSWVISGRSAEIQKKMAKLLKKFPDDVLEEFLRKLLNWFPVKKYMKEILDELPTDFLIELSKQLFTKFWRNSRMNYWRNSWRNSLRNLWRNSQRSILKYSWWNLPQKSQILRETLNTWWNSWRKSWRNSWKKPGRNSCTVSLEKIPDGAFRRTVEWILQKLPE